MPYVASPVFSHSLTSGGNQYDVLIAQSTKKGHHIDIMNKFLGNLLDNLSNYLAQRRGMLPLLGVLLIIINFVLQIIPGESWWIVSSNLFLHLGLVVGLIGILLIRPLE